MILYIYTLGDFDIKLEGDSLLKDSNRAYTLYKLLQYFITFRNKKLLPSNIIENIWPENESYDPNNMLRAQIFRLRQLIKNTLPEDLDGSKYLNISFNNGYYSLEIGEMTRIDNEEFETLISIGDNNKIDNIDNAIGAYESALRLYRGSYLEENAHELWVVPMKNYYNRLYIKTLFNLIEILKEREKYDKIIELCEAAISIEPYEEAIHIYLMEAMLKLGEIKHAMSHYEYTSSLIAKEMNSKLSPAMIDINRKIQNNFSDKSEMNINNINNKLEDESIEGPLLCEIEYFKFLFNNQMRNRPKGEELDYICLITLNANSNYPQEELNTWTNNITKAIDKALRKGDVFSFWNDSQILVILKSVKVVGLDSIEDRIRKYLKTISRDKRYDITIKFTPITSNFTII